MRDLLPDAMRRRQYVTDTLRDLFEAFGFEPLQTPAIETASTLLGKYGTDAERLIYRAGLASGAMDLALRYDLTVPLARVCALANLPRPFKRYQIAPVWRGERPQRGRYREFVQADADIVGTRSMLADAEILALVTTGLDRLGFTGYTLKVNNRRILAALGRYAGVPAGLLPAMYRAIDKLDKVGLAGVRQELQAVGLPGELLNRQRQAAGRWVRGQADRDRLARDMAEAVGDDAPAGVATRGITAFLDSLAAFPNGGGDDATADAAADAALGAGIAALRSCYPPDALVPEAVVDRLLDLLQLRGASRDLLAALRDRLDDAEADAGIDELSAVLDALDAAGVAADRYGVDVAMVRGLDYYTGTIFEAVVDDPPIGSILGGGRYDHLLGVFGKASPAVGASFGVDRLVDVMETLDLFPPQAGAPAADVLVTVFDPSTSAASVALATALRRAGIRTELYFEPDRIGDQIRYALRRGTPFVAVVGPDEVSAGTVVVRDLGAKSQEVVARGEVAAWLRLRKAAPPTTL